MGNDIKISCNELNNPIEELEFSRWKLYVRLSDVKVYKLFCLLCNFSAKLHLFLIAFAAKSLDCGVWQIGSCLWCQLPRRSCDLECFVTYVLKTHSHTHRKKRIQDIAWKDSWTSCLLLMLVFNNSAFRFFRSAWLQSSLLFTTFSCGAIKIAKSRSKNKHVK